MGTEEFIGVTAYTLGANLLFLILVVAAGIVAKKKKKLAYTLYFIGLGLQVLSVLARLKSLQLAASNYSTAVYSLMQKQVSVSTVVSVILALVGIAVVASAKGQPVNSAQQTVAEQNKQP